MDKLKFKINQLYTEIGEDDFLELSKMITKVEADIIDFVIKNGVLQKQLETKIKDLENEIYYLKIGSCSSFQSK